jgi:hypothetical protein
MMFEGTPLVKTIHPHHNRIGMPQQATHFPLAFTRSVHLPDSTDRFSLMVSGAGVPVYMLYLLDKV